MKKYFERFSISQKEYDILTKAQETGGLDPKYNELSEVEFDILETLQDDLAMSFDGQPTDDAIREAIQTYNEQYGDIPLGEIHFQFLKDMFKKD